MKRKVFLSTEKGLVLVVERYQMPLTKEKGFRWGIYLKNLERYRGFQQSYDSAFRSLRNFIRNNQNLLFQEQGQPT